MMITSRFLVVLSTLFVVYASAYKTTIVHTTDIHGYLYGHRHLPDADATMGEFASFMSRLKQQGEKNKDEVLFFDSGDLIDGTGLSDATEYKGKFIIPTMALLRNYTAFTIGNHDLQHKRAVNLMHFYFANKFAGRYITSNTRYVHTNGTQEPFGANYFFTVTPRGTRMLVLGYIFDFTQNINFTRVVPVQESVQEQYFKEAMEFDVDLIVVLCHIDPQTPPDIATLHKALRHTHTHTKIVFLTGHAHRLYYKVWDNNTVVLESGRYMEHFGVLTWHTNTPQNDHNSVDNSPHEHNWATTVQHTYYSTNRTAFCAILGFGHTNTCMLDTYAGNQINAQVRDEYHRLRLDTLIGCSKRYYTPQAALDADDSLYGLYLGEIAPNFLYKKEFNLPQIIISNTGMLRTPLYEGKVLLDDLYMIDPFNSTYHYYANLKAKEGEKIPSYIPYPGVPTDTLVIERYLRAQGQDC